MTKEQLLGLKEKNKRRKEIKEKTTAGPWYIRILDDNKSMNLIAISTVPDTEKQEKWPNFDQGTLVAATLIQSPQYVDIADQCWQENADFISFARNDPVELDVDFLIDLVDQLLEKVEILEKNLLK